MEADGTMSKHHFAYDGNVRPTVTSNIGKVDCNMKTNFISEQEAAIVKVNRGTADCQNYDLRRKAVSGVDVDWRSESRASFEVIRSAITPTMMMLMTVLCMM
jgi:hypothetical protein